MVGPAVLTITGPAQDSSQESRRRRAAALPSLLLTTVRHGGHWLVPPCSGSPSLAPLKPAPGGYLSRFTTDCSPARPCGPWLVPPCCPSLAPLKSAPGCCLSESNTDYSPVRSGGPWLVRPCSPGPCSDSFPSLLLTRLLLIFGASQARRLGKPSLSMRLAGSKPHRREATRSGRALGQGPWALTHTSRGPHLQVARSQIRNNR